MASAFYFALLVIAVFSVSAYVISTGFSLVDIDATIQRENLEPSNACNRLQNSEKITTTYSKNECNNGSGSITSDGEIKKQRRQLKRNLITLNYISMLESNPKMINNPKRMEEIKNLRQGVQRQILKNTDYLNSCISSQMAKSSI